MNSQTLVRTGKEEAVGHIEINRSSKANAYNQAVLKELKLSLEAMEADSDIRALVITGAGERSFCAGADLDEMRTRDFTDALNLESGRLFASLAAYPKVTLAAINGAAVAGGLELALACDLRICSENASFRLPETRLGLIPAAGGTQRLPKVVGIARAKELILGGRTWSADDALRFGLVSEVVRLDQLRSRAQQWGEQIGEGDPVALLLAKKAIDSGTSYSQESSVETIAEALLYRIKNEK